MTKAVVLLSGGLDSTTLLYDIRALGLTPYALSVNYGQRHKKELDYAKKTCKRLEVEHRIVELGKVGESLLAGSSQTSPDIAVPEGHYTEESMKATVVPNRNMIMLSLAAAWAISLEADMLAYAAHSGDHAIYPDCRPEFVFAMQQAIAIADHHLVDLYTPFLHSGKESIVELAVHLEVPFADTWSCYKGEELHCGKCGTCVERKEAFTLAGVEDPTKYQ